ncbi:hypothetical protein GCM10010219_03720 [Streptomyces netropsis]|nr:hypothetical protein GCM10010219_03720 [Streptomyces netropsis]
MVPGEFDATGFRPDRLAYVDGHRGDDSFAVWSKTPTRPSAPQAAPGSLPGRPARVRHWNAFQPIR